MIIHAFVRAQSFRTLVGYVAKWAGLGSTVAAW
jgi:hypothetical protein